jgi:hypothetical protein
MKNWVKGKRIQFIKQQTTTNNNKQQQMKKIIYTYGVISGLIAAGLMTLAMIMKDRMEYSTAMVVGYTNMILALSLIFFAIQSYKKNHGNISFGKCFRIGLGITAICSLFYVIAWAIVYNTLMPNYMEDYSRYTIEKMQKAGSSETAIKAAVEEMKYYAELYKNPVFFVLFTLLEIVPVGLIVSLIAALVEKFKTKKQTPQAV